MTILGESVIRMDAKAKAQGEALYPGDFNLPNQCYMKVLFAERPHAKIINIDTSLAEALPGVIAVFTAKDVPVNQYGLIQPDQPVLCGPGSNQPYADHVRFVGDQVALIVAETEEIASKARGKIVVDYEDLPIVSDPREAMKPGAVLVHPETGSNIFRHQPVIKGDVEKGFKEADVIVEAEYVTPMQEHAYLQPEAGVAYIDEEDRVTVVVGGQWTHEDQQQISHSLGLPEEKVRIIYPAIGGAFGGREDMSVQIILGLAAWRLHQRGIDRPVKIIWSREESITGHGKRHAYYFKARWGATKQGKIVAADIHIVADGGAYAYTSTKVLGNAIVCATGPYEIPNVKIDAYAVYTNNVPGAAFRGFGGPQGHFEAETQMGKLAEVLGMDPVEIRIRNMLREGSLLSVNTPILPGVSIVPVAEKCAEAAGWKNTGGKWERKTPLASQVEGRPYLRRGIGFACGYKNVGFSYGMIETCSATIEIRGSAEIEHVLVRHSAAEVGQGTHTAIAQMAAHALNVPLEKIEMILSDTARTGNAGSVSASRMTFMAAGSIKGAADLALKKWKNEERPAIAHFTYEAPKTTPMDPETGECLPNFGYGYVAEVAEVELDMDTGHVRIVNLICADDVGKAVNPQLVQGQIEGAVVQAAGYTLLENFVTRDGVVLTPTLSTYLIPTVLDIPDKVEALILEYPDPVGAWGVRGMAEMPYIPMAAAVVAAVHAATGVWYDEFPLVPERILRGLGKIET